LQRQTVDEVNVDGCEAEAAGLLDVLTGELERLHALHRLLNGRIEILKSHRQPVETEIPQGREVLHGRHTGVDFQRDLGVRTELEARGDGVEELPALCGRQVGRGASAPMELAEYVARRQRFTQEIELGLDRFEIVHLGPSPRRDHHVASAEGAARLAERKMHVHRERFFRAPRGEFETFPVGGLVEIRREMRRRRVRGVARTRTVIPLK
jgi:hypothetical protein